MKLLTVADVAEMLGIGKTRVLKLIHEGRLQAHRIGGHVRPSTQRADLRPWIIRPEDVEAVRVRANKRGPKPKGST